MESVLVRAFEGDTKPLNRLKSKCHDVWLKIREMLTRIARTIVNEYKGLKPDSEAGRFVAELSDDTFNVLKDMYFDAIGKVAETRQHFHGLDELVAFLDEHNISREGTDLEHYKTKNTADQDIRYSQRDYQYALTSSEWKKYNYAMISKVDAGLRVSDHSILVECEDGEYSYKLVVYDNETEENDIIAIYGIGENLYNDDVTNFDAKFIGEFLTELEDKKYDNKQMLERLLKTYSKNVGYVLGRYNTRSHRFNQYGRKVSEGSKIIRQQDERNRVHHSNQGDGVILYQARPDFEDILFDDFDGKVTDDDSRLITEYINGKTDVVNHLINNTRSIPLSEHKMRSLVSRLLKSYELSENSKNDVYIALTSLLESNDKTDVKDNLELLQGVFSKVIRETDFVSEYDKNLRKDVYEYLRDYRKTHSVYLTDEQVCVGI